MQAEVVTRSDRPLTVAGLVPEDWWDEIRAGMSAYDPRATPLIDFATGRFWTHRR